MTTLNDGTIDDKISCFKANGSIGERGIELLRQFRLDQANAKDGEDDEEEAGLSEDEDDFQLDAVDDDENLFIAN